MINFWIYCSLLLCSLFDTLIFLVASKPSSWFSNSNMVLWTWKTDFRNGMACGDLIIQIFEVFRYLAVPAAPRLNPGRPNGVDLVHEDDGGRVLPRHHKQLPHHPAALACSNRTVAVCRDIDLWDLYRWTSGQAPIRKREWKCILCDEQLRAQAGSCLIVEYATLDCQ